MASDNNSANVTVGKPKITGAIYTAPIGTQLPTDATTTLNSAFKCLGYVSEDGLTNNNSPESGTIKAWGGDTVHTYWSAKDDTFSFTLIEALNIEVLKTVYGAENVTGSLSTGITVAANSNMTPNMEFVVETILNGAIKRIVIPTARIAEVGEITYADESALGYALTINANPDSSGNTHYEYIIEQ